MGIALWFVAIAPAAAEEELLGNLDSMRDRMLITIRT